MLDWLAEPDGEIELEIDAEKDGDKLWLELAENEELNETDCEELSDFDWLALSDWL